jgi:hypothetical protein
LVNPIPTREVDDQARDLGAAVQHCMDEGG